jgi:hypothetical protein
MYEGVSVEPLGYTVSGSFQLIRYARNAQKNIGGKVPDKVAKNDSGNGVGNWGGTWDKTKKGFASRNGLGNDGRAHEALDPSKLDNGTTFDIEVYQKTSKGDIGVAKIRNVRIVQSDFAISKRSTAIQRFNFVALYADEDAFVADFSGKGQHFE